MKTIVYQSFRTSGVPGWVRTCLSSVEDWATAQGFEYRFYDDEIFERVPAWVLNKAGRHLQIATDLGRLVLARELLAEGYRRVVWIDADILIFDPEGFALSLEDEYAFGREIWVQPSGKGRGGIKAYKNVHNAIAVFCQGNSFLDFYIHSSLKILRRVEGPMVPQIIGTKFLTALHNIAGFTLIDEVGMASPLVVRDVANGGGPALKLLCQKSPQPLSALNLCTSLAGGEADDVVLSTALMEAVCKRLLEQGRGLFPP
jgi:hypothetical protein